MKKFVLLFTVLMVSVLSMGQSLQITKLNPIGTNPNLDWGGAGNAPDPAGPITGPATVCASTTGVTYSVDPIAGAASYSWTVPPNAIITAGAGTLSITVDYPANALDGNVVVMGLNDWGAGTLSSKYVLVKQRPVITITGNATVCQGSTGNVYTTQAGMTNYVWTVSGGGTITSGGGAGDNTVTVTWNNTGAQSVSVNYTNASNCNATSAKVYDVTVNALPTPTITSGPTAPCQLSTGNVYTTQAGNSNYVWTVSAGGTITAGGGANDNTVTVTWNTVGAQTVSVNYQNAINCTAAAPYVYNLDVKALPTPTITGDAAACLNTPGHVYTTEVGMSNYVWNITGGTITAGTGTASVTVTWTVVGAGNITVNYNNADNCAAASATVKNVTVNALPVVTLTGATAPCQGITGQVYTTEAGKSNYVWNVSAGGTVTAGGGAADNTVTVTWNTVGAQTVSVNYQDANSCSAATDKVINVDVKAIPVVTITGNATACFHSTGNVYTTEAGMTNYAWNVSAGGTITAGGANTDNSVTVTWDNVGAQTVSVNYVNGNGCTAVAPTIKNVTVNGTIPVITGPATACKGFDGHVYSTQAGGTNYVWTVSAGGQITAGTGTNSITVKWNQRGAQTVSVTFTDGNGCNPPAPTVYNETVKGPSITGPTQTCRLTTYNYSTEVGMASYVWAIPFGGNITSGQGTPNITVQWTSASSGNPLTPRSLNCTYTDGTCTTTTTLSVIVYPSQANIFIVGATSPCQNTSVQYFTDAGQTNYSWTLPLGGGTITAGGTSTDNFITVLWTAAGSRSVAVSYANSLACSVTPKTQAVTVKPLPVPTITGPAGCLTSGQTYTTEAGMSNYVWSVSAGGTVTAGGTSTSNSVTVTWTALGAQTVSVSYTHTNGCTAAAPTVKNITVNSLPVPTITGPASACLNVAGQVYTTEAGMTNYTWSVVGGTITAGGGAGHNSATVTWTSLGAQSISVNYTNANSCTGAAPTSKSVTVNTLPTPTILSGPTAPCQLSTGNVYTTEAGKSNYVWAVSAGGTITAGGGINDNSVTVTWNTVGAQTVSINYSDGNNCTAATPFIYNVDVKSIPAPTITGDADACINTTGHVYTTEAGMTGYTWNITGGTITAGALTPSVTVTWTNLGVGALTVNYTNANNCQAVTPGSKNVNVHPLPVVTLNGPNAPCVGITNQVYTTEAGKSNYLWTVSAGGTITAGGGVNDNTVTVTWNTVGAQTVSVNYQDANNCTAVTPTTFNVDVKALPVVSITGNATPCVNSTGIVYTTQPGMTNYAWVVSGGGTVTAGGAATDNTVTVTWNAVGAQTVSVNYTNGTGCTAVTPYIYNVDVKPLPTPSVTSGPNHICGVPAVGQTYQTQVGFNNYVWTVSAGGTITAGQGTASINVTWSTSGNKTVTVTYKTAFGCEAVAPASYSVDVFDLPVATLNGPLTPCINSAGNMYVTEAGMSNYVWNIPPGATVTAGGTIADNSVSITWTSSGAKTITVTYADANNCSPATPASINVDVKALPVPTITPPSSNCATTGNVYTTEAGMLAYNWTLSGTGVITSGAGTNSITVDWTGNAGPQTVTVTYTSSFGCAAASPTLLNINVLAAPSPTITGLGEVCSRSVKVYTTEIGKSNYVWAVTGGSIVAGQGTASVQVLWNNFTIQTSCSVSVNYSAPSGCSAGSPTVKTVLVDPLPVPTLTQTPPFVVGNGVCIGGTYTYTTEGGHANYSWNVSPGGTILDGGTFLDNFITVTWNLLGAQSVSTNWENSYGCAAYTMTVQNVTVTPLPVPTITGPATVCDGHGGYVYTTEAGMPAYVWNVTGGGVITSGAGTNSITVTWNTLAAKTVTISYTNNSGCQPVTPTVYNVSTNPSPTPTIAGPIASCVNQTKNYTTQVGQSNYTWTVSAGGTITSGQGTASINVLWNTAGAQMVTVNYNNSFGCSGVTPANYNVTVNPLPVPTIAGPTPVCNHSTGNVYSTEGGMTGYTWTVTGGTITAGTGTASVTVTWNVAGTGNLTVNYTNGNGCTAATPTSYNVVVNALPVPTITGPASVCINSTGNVYTTEAGMSNYTYDIQGGIITGGIGTNSVTVTWNTVGAQWIKVKYTDLNGCVAEQWGVQNVTVNPLPVPTITGSNPVCVTTNNIYTTEAGMTNYQWNVTGAGTITAGGGVADNTITITWNTDGAKTVSVNYVDPNGCTAVAPTVKNVTVNPDATLVLNTGNNTQSLCINTPISNIVYTIGGGATGVNAVGLPAGVTGTLVGNTYTISGSPTVVGSFNYSITTTGVCVQLSAIGTLTVNPDATIALTSGVGSNNQTLCINNAITDITYTIGGGGTGAFVAGLPAGVTGSFNAGVFTITGTPTVSGIFNYTVTTTGTCLQANANGTLTVNPDASITLTSPGGSNNQNLCINVPIVNITYAIGGGGTGASVTGLPNGVTGSYAAGVFTISGSPTEVGTFNYTVSTSGICIQTSANGSITVNPDATIALTTGNQNQTVCIDNAITNIVYTIGGGGTGANVVGLPAGVTGVFAAGQFTISGAPSVAGTFNYTVTTTGTCVQVSANGTIVSNAAPATPTITGPAAVCYNKVETYFTEGGYSNYNWGVVNGTILSGSGTATVVVLWNGVPQGVGSITVNYTNVNNCAAALPATKPITINPLPVVTLAQAPAPVNANDVCQSYTYTYTTEAGKTNYVWAVSPGGTIVGGGTFLHNYATIVWSVLGPQSVSVNWQNEFGCVAQNVTTYQVNVTPLPTPTITGTNTVCVGTTNVAYSTEAGMSGYTWNISAGGTITAGAGTNSILVTWNTVGAQSVSVNYTNPSGCTAAAPTVYAVTVNALPTPFIFGPTTVCAVSVNNIYNTNPGQSNYVWTVSAGGTITSGAGTNTIHVTWSGAGAQTVTVNYQNAEGCTAVTPASLNVTVYPTFTVGSISANQSITGGTAPAELIGVAPTGGNAPYSYQWQVSTDNITFTDIPLASTINYQPGILNQTTYYRQIQFSSGPCGSLITNTVTIVVSQKVSGILTYDNGPTYTPLAGFTVELKSVPGNITVASTTTNASGYYEFFAPNGNYRIVASPPPGAIFYAELDDASAIFDYTNGIIGIMNTPLRVLAGDVAQPLNGIPDLDDFLAVFFFANGDPSYYDPSTPSWIFETTFVTVNNNSVIKNFLGLHSGNVTGSYPNPF